MRKTTTIAVALFIVLTITAPITPVAEEKEIFFSYIPFVNKRETPMKIAKFGPDYDSAYTFGDALMEDDWTSARPPISQAVGGADGAFDYYGENNFPVSPLTVTKKFALTSSTSSADIEDQLNELRDATIAIGRSNLWWLDRDETTTYWSKAKCTSLNASETYKEKGRWLKNVTLTFFMPEGLWYGSALQTWSNTITIPASTVGQAVTGLTNSGNYPAKLDVRIVPRDSLTVNPCGAYVRDVAQWEYAANVADGPRVLEVRASQYECIVRRMVEREAQLIVAGQSADIFGDGRFIYSANTTDGIHSYSVDGSGLLTAVDSDDQGDTAYGVWSDGVFVYLANGTGGLHTYSVDDSGSFTHLDSDDQGGVAYAVWGDGNFVYLANELSGLLSYSVDASGTLTYIDTDDQGGLYRDVWGDGTYIYAAAEGAGLIAYTVDGSGNFTLSDTEDRTGTYGNYEGVWGDGTFIYVTTAGGYLLSHSIDEDGAIVFIDALQTGTTSRGVWGDGTFVYAFDSTEGATAHRISATGEIEYIIHNDPGAGGGYYGWYDGTYVYMANTSTIRVYEMVNTDSYVNLTIGSSALLDQPSIDQVAWMWLPAKVTSLFRISVDCDAGGGGEEVDVYVSWWDTYVF